MIVTSEEVVGIPQEEGRYGPKVSIPSAENQSIELVGNIKISTKYQHLHTTTKHILSPMFQESCQASCPANYKY